MDKSSQLKCLQKSYNCANVENVFMVTALKFEELMYEVLFQLLLSVTWLSQCLCTSQQ